MAAGLGLVASAVFFGLPARGNWFVALLILSCLAAIGSPAVIGSIRLSTSSIIVLAAIPLVGPFGAALVGMTSILFVRTEFIKDVYNTAQRVLLALAGAVTFRLVGGGQLGNVETQADALDLAWQLAVATGAAALTNVALLSGIIVITSAGSFRVILIDVLKQAIPAYFIYGVAAYVLTVLWAPAQLGWISALFFFPSLYVIQWALIQHATVWSARHEVLTPFVVALDERYPGAQRESRMVADVATGIANSLGLKPSVVDSVGVAAQLRDLGKLVLEGQPEAIMRRDHAKESWKVVEGVTFLDDSLAMAAGHHERVDGQGWPKGLEGDAIPLGSRILAVAETWTHRMMQTGDPEAAVIRCETLAGTGLDVRCVTALRRAHERGQLPAGEPA